MRCLPSPSILATKNNLSIYLIFSGTDYVELLVIAHFNFNNCAEFSLDIVSFLVEWCTIATLPFQSYLHADQTLIGNSSAYSQASSLQEAVESREVRRILPER